MFSDIAHFRDRGDALPPLHELGDKYQPATAMSRQHPLKHPRQLSKQVLPGDNITFLVCGQHRSTQIYYHLHLSGGVRVVRSSARVRCPATSSSLRVVGLWAERVGHIVGDVVSTRFHCHQGGTAICCVRDRVRVRVRVRIRVRVRVCS
jgi:hypothetical protein